MVVTLNTAFDNFEIQLGSLLLAYFLSLKHYSRGIILQTAEYSIGCGATLDLLTWRIFENTCQAVCLLRAGNGEGGRRSPWFGLLLPGIICKLFESLFSLGLVLQAASPCCSFSMSWVAINYLPNGNEWSQEPSESTSWGWSTLRGPLEGALVECSFQWVFLKKWNKGRSLHWYWIPVATCDCFAL